MNHFYVIPMRLKLIFIGLGLVFLSGCGLIHIPWRRTIPPPALRSIAVFDAQTRLPIADARVQFEIPRFGLSYIDNSGLACWGVVDEDDWIEGEPVMALGSGRFNITPVHRWCWFHVTFPLGFPSGFGLYRTYGGDYNVNAPGYQTVFFCDATARIPADKLLDDFHPQAAKPKRTYLEFTPSQTNVFLPRRVKAKDTVKAQKTNSDNRQALDQ